MCNQRKIFLALLVLLSLLCGCAGSTERFRAEYYSSEENEQSYLLENDILRFELDGATSYFTLTDKRSGRVWTSVPETEDATAATAAQNAMRSTLLLTYTDRTGKNTLYDDYTYSIQNGSFSVTREGDALRVDYMIGPFERIYCIPQVIDDARMEAFLNQMSAEQQMAVRKCYLHYDLESMSEKKREKILPLLPQLENGPVYALSSVTGGSLQNYQLEQLEEAFLAAGYTEDDRTADLPADEQESAEILQYNVSVYYRLSGDALRVEIPTEQIGYPEEYPVKTLHVLPYFCAASDRSEGWLLVPDGGGAQIELNNGKTQQAAYYSELYGRDEAMTLDRRTQETDSAFPVFGIMADGAWLMAVGRSGNAAMAVEADVSGKGSAYNYARPVYDIVCGEATTVSEKSKESLWVYQSEHPQQTIILDYICGNSDSYVEMAERYRDCLLEDAPRALGTEGSLTTVIDFVGTIDLTRASFGVPTQHIEAASDYAEVCAAVEQLATVSGLRLRYSGVLNGGLKQTALLKAEVESVLGGESERSALLEAVSAQSGRLYLQGYVQQVFAQSPFDGFSKNSDAIRSTVNEVVEQKLYAPDSLLADDDTSIYLLKQDVADRAVEALRSAAQVWGADGIALSDYGNVLYSDFSRTGGLSREDALNAQQTKLWELRQEGTPLLLSGANDYAVMSADCVTDMDLFGGEYDILDAHIPFYQIALHGYVPYTGTALNLSENYELTLLRSVEYGAGMSWRFLEMDSAELKNSPYTYHYRLYSARFADWSEELLALYQRWNDELGHTAALTITDHRILNDGLTLTEYSDGTQVYVNYGFDAAQVDGLTIPSRDWLVREGNR